MSQEEPNAEGRLFIRGDYDELRAASTAEIIAAARRAMTRRVHRGTAMNSPRAVREFLAVKLGTLEHEIFAILLLDLCGADIYVRRTSNTWAIRRFEDFTQHY
jgi:DNA repair protein RadC